MQIKSNFKEIPPTKAMIAIELTIILIILCNENKLTVMWEKSVYDSDLISICITVPHTASQNCIGNFDEIVSIPICSNIWKHVQVLIILISVMLSERIIDCFSCGN